MNGVPSVIVEDLHVSYESLIDKRRSFRAKLRDRDFGRRFKEIHAVRGVSFELYRGETVGVIGSNGSGKSTLMGALAGLIPIKSGRVAVRSRPTLLGVNAAMRSPLSGRHNILVGGVALGLDKNQVEELVDEIIDFSGLEDSIDRPLRTYSAGMRARLIFSIATCISPDILLIDEALAVGDRAFSRRSRQRLDEIRSSAGTVVVVSHNMGEIKASDRAIWLEEGIIRLIGDPEEVVEAYEAFTDEAAPAARA